VSEEVIRKRAEELEETGKGIAHLSANIYKYPQMQGSSPASVAETESSEKIKVRCRHCYQEYELPAGTTEWRCDVCGTDNVV